MTRAIRIVLADDHALVAEGLRAVLDAEGDMEVVEVLNSGDGLLDVIRRQEPDVVVLDLEMGAVGGLTCLERIATERLPTKVVVLTAHSSPAVMRQAWDRGAAGFAMKSEPPRQTLGTIRQVAAGRLVFPTATRTTPLNRETLDDLLTGRERAVLSALAEGLTNAKIARRLGITSNTVKFHLQNVFTKLDVRSRTEAVARYLKESG